MTPDVNVLVAAFRADHAHHAAARSWLDQSRRACLAGRTSLTLLPVVVTGFLRLVTNARVFVQPDAVRDAVAFVDALLASPGVEWPAQPENSWPLLRSKLLARARGGNLVTDTWIAALVEAHGEHLVTFDRDFTGLLAVNDLTLLA
jgi:uncharacterized protein